MKQRLLRISLFDEVGFSRPKSRERIETLREARELAAAARFLPAEKPGAD